jgi:hypothetical protein
MKPCRCGGANLIKINRDPTKRRVSNRDIEREDDGKQDDRATIPAFNLLGFDSPK